MNTIQNVINLLNHPVVQQDWLPLALLLSGFVAVMAIYRIADRIREIWK